MTQKPISRKSPVSRLLWLLIMLGMALAAGAQWLVPEEEAGSIPAFYCLLGLGASFVLILFSRLLGFILKRPQNYWVEDSVGGDDI